MIWNVIRIVLLIWVVRVIYKWYSAYREIERRKAYERGRRDAGVNPTSPNNDTPSGEYIDFEELK